MDEACKKRLQRCIILPHKYIMGILGCLALLNAYTMRLCIMVAITEMVSSDDGERINPVTDKSKVYDWTDVQQRMILDSFYIGYLIMHLPGSVLAEKYGVKYVMGLSLLFTAILTLLTPLVVSYGDWRGVLALRVLEGLGEGPIFPALNTMLAKWVPLRDRSKIGSIAYSGGQLGTMVSILASASIIKATGTWTSIFYFFGMLAILWFVIWMLLFYSRPSTHPFIEAKELECLKEGLVGVREEHVCTPWMDIFTSLPVWALVVAGIGHDWGFYTMVSELPRYMNDVLHLSISNGDLQSAAPHFVMASFAIVSGYLCDVLVNENYFTISFARKFFSILAAIMPGLLMLAASYSEHDEKLVMGCFMASMGFMGTSYPGSFINGLDLSPNYAGTIMAIVNGIGAITGLILPVVVGLVVTKGGDKLIQWRCVFWITFGVFVITSLIYIFYGSGELQFYNNPENYMPSKAERSAQRS